MNTRRVIVASAGCLLALFLPCGSAIGSEIEWVTSLKSALKESAATGKPVLVDVWANWCAPCKQMDETTYRDPQVVDASHAFVPVKVDHDLQELFVERYNIEALPQVLYLDAEGREISRMAGLIEAPQLLARMMAVRDGYAAYLEAIERPRDPVAARTAGSYLLAAGNPGGAARLLRKALKRLEKKAAAQREPLELSLAEAQLAAGEMKSAAATFERLSASAAERRIRGLALDGLARVQRKRDGAAAAAATLERLRSEYPEIAAEVTTVPDRRP